MPNVPTPKVRLYLPWIIAALALPWILSIAHVAEARQGTELDYRWVALGESVVYDWICYYPEGPEGDQVCFDSCPPDSGAICAEYRNTPGDVRYTCCILPDDVGSYHYGACLIDVELIRDEDPPPGTPIP